jgi:hypothetical protein
MRGLVVCVLSCSLQLFGPFYEVRGQGNGRPELIGTWKSDNGVVYSIEKSVSGYIWKAEKIDESATLWFLGPGKVRAVWTGGSGEGSATGYIVSVSQGHATKIVWDSGALFQFQDGSVADVPGEEPDQPGHRLPLPQVAAPEPPTSSEPPVPRELPGPPEPSPLVHVCEPRAVAAFPERLQVRCATGQGIIVDELRVENFGFATSDPDQSGQVLNILLTAFTEGKSVAIHYYKGRQEAAQVGCQVRPGRMDCLQMWAVEIRR